MRAPDFWRRRSLAAILLAPLGALYGLSVALKAHFAKPFDAGLPVICVGNLTAGGSGKTPVAIAIAERLRAKDHKPFFSPAVTAAANAARPWPRVPTARRRWAMKPCCWRAPRPPLWRATAPPARGWQRRKAPPCW